MPSVSGVFGKSDARLNAFGACSSDITEKPKRLSWSSVPVLIGHQKIFRRKS